MTEKRERERDRLYGMRKIHRRRIDGFLIADEVHTDRNDCNDNPNYEHAPASNHEWREKQPKQHSVRVRVRRGQRASRRSDRIPFYDEQAGDEK